MILHKQKAFTLVELIIVITILATLATIAFMSFSSYVSKSRDTQRLSTLTNLEKWLVSSQITTGKLPLPDNSITISSSWEILLHEGIFWPQVASLIWVSQTPKDPLSGKNIYYVINKNQTEFQLLSYFENQVSSLIDPIYANANIPRTQWGKIWVILDQNNQIPTTSLDIQEANSGAVYKILYANNKSISLKGTSIEHSLKQIEKNNWFSLQIKWWNASVWNLADEQKILEHAQALGLNTVTVPVRIDIPNVNSEIITIHQQSKEDAKILVQLLRKNNIWVILEPYPFINNGDVSETLYNPTNQATFFTNWENILWILIDEIALPYDIQWLYIASNLVNLEWLSSHWMSIINFVKETKQYNWAVIYRTNWWITTPRWTSVWDTSWDYLMVAYNNKLNNPLFWEVDMIAVSWYFELSPLNEPTLDEVKTAIKFTQVHNQRWQNVYQEVMNFYSKWNKPVFFWELWFPSKTWAAAQPWNNLTANTDSQLNQANLFQWYLETFWETEWFWWFSVFLLWHDSSEYNIIWKQAQQVVTNYNK